MASLLISAWFKSNGVAALPGYFIADTPWAGVKAQTTWARRTQGGTFLGGGYSLSDSGAQNSLIDNDQWLASGTFKVAVIYRNDIDAGIYSLQWDGVEKATVDSYATPGAVGNNYSEVTGIAHAAAALVVTRIKMATKNASSSNYWPYLQTVAWVRTGA